MRTLRLRWQSVPRAVRLAPHEPRPACRDASGRTRDGVAASFVIVVLIVILTVVIVYVVVITVIVLRLGMGRHLVDLGSKVLLLLCRSQTAGWGSGRRVVAAGCGGRRPGARSRLDI